MNPFTICLASLLAVSAHAARFSVSVAPSQQLDNPSSLPSSTHAVILGPAGVRYDVPLRRDNTFIFPDLADASYLLTIHSRDHFFPPLRVDVSKTEESEGSQQTITAWQTFRGNEWSHKGPLYGSGQNELSISVRPNGAKQFYQERGGFSLLSFFKSPMILMALVSLVMVFGMPYLMENMDPETKKEFEEMQAKQPLTGSDGPAAQIQNFDLAGWMAGKPSASSGGTPGGGNKRK